MEEKMLEQFKNELDALLDKRDREGVLSIEEHMRMDELWRVWGGHQAREILKDIGDKFIEGTSEERSLVRSLLKAMPRFDRENLFAYWKKMFGGK